MNISDKIPAGKQLILFDGVCNFCDRTVQRILKADTRNLFVFASLQSDTGQEIMRYAGIPSTTDSVILYQPGTAYYTESDAVLEIARQLGGLYPLLLAAKIIPKRVRDAAYRYVARNRYKWYGKKEACSIPTPETRAKFLS